jgi:hypothetical protein
LSFFYLFVIRDSIRVRVRVKVKVQFRVGLRFVVRVSVMITIMVKVKGYGVGLPDKFEAMFRGLYFHKKILVRIFFIKTNIVPEETKREEREQMRRSLVFSCIILI